MHLHIFQFDDLGKDEVASLIKAQSNIDDIAINNETDKIINSH